MIGQRLKQLRLARGLSLEMLAAEMGGVLTKQALSKYEQGKMQPSREIVHKLAFALKVKTTYLWSNSTVQIVAYRKGSRLSKKEQERIESVVWLALEERVRLQNIIQPDNGIDMPVQEMPVEKLDDAEVAAAKLRERWNLGVDPIANVTNMLEAHNVHVIEIDTSEKFDGISALAQDESKQNIAAAVVSRRSLPGERQRLSLIHELAHLVLKVSPRCDEEKVAFRFAAAFIAPAQIVYHEIGTKRSFLQAQELLLLKRHLGISVQALLYRLRDLGIITESYYKKWCIDISRLGWRKKEPLEIPCEKPVWLHRSLLRALSESVITQEEAQSMLGEDLDMVEPLSLIKRRAFMKLSLEDRRLILTQQAEKMAAHYEEDSEWRDLGGGEVIEY